MKPILQAINASPLFTKAFEWGRLLTITGFSQFVVQAVGFICGILIIRMLPTTEYALYTIANTMVGTMAVLADGGISTGVTAQGGQVWRDRDQLGKVLATGLDLRKKFGLAWLVITVPLMLLMLKDHDAGWLTSILIVVAVIPAFFSTLSASLLQIAPRLKQDIGPLQKIQVMSNLMRLLLLSTTLLFFPFASIAILAASVSQIWANIRLKKISIVYADWRQKPDAQIGKQIVTFVKRLLPGSIYYCLSGQITIWLISVFGSTTAIAHIGALSRLAMLLSLFNIMVNTLVVPRFARLADKKNILFDWYVRIQLGLVLVSMGVIGLVWFFPEQILWVLGENYAGLKMELMLCMIGCCLNLVVGISHLLNASRGWLLHPLVGIVVGLAGIVGGVLLLDISTLRGVLLFNIFTGVVGLFIHPLFGFLKIMKSKVAYG